ncbi:membrane-anchored protein [Geitlerinema sp. P-1104]|uniref:GDYXXLXY domain-containing protein n=1 Tax=Geitlerinema sp. P-1104 TaxID=2546230 RepID=UPI001476AEE6|nr:GDYXXLXY domain-containing protein [Geitlerinema sp. P-1104]NMG58505.1 membrane-anchored protein [Geitlerinema sp. P-1104]
MTQDLIPNAAETQPESQATGKPRRFPQWRFWLPLLLQSFLILAVPARDAHTVITGTPVVLQTAPVDPYDILRGYYQTLSYDISQRQRLQELPGGNELFNSPLFGDRNTFDFYVILEEPSEAAAPGERPLPWLPVAVSAERPDDLASNQIALRGQHRNWQILYGLERYYMPEDQRNDINNKIMQIQVEEPESFVVQIKVSDRAHAVPISLWVGEQNYEF